MESKNITARRGTGPRSKIDLLWGGDRYRKLLFPEMAFCPLAPWAGALVGEALKRGPRVPACLRVPSFRVILISAWALIKMGLFPFIRAHLTFLHAFGIS